MTETIDTTKIDQFAQLIQEGIDAWKRAGKLLVEMLDADPNIKTEITDRCPDLTPAILSKFEAVGREALDSRLLMAGSPGKKALRTLPLSDQRKALESPVEVWEGKDSRMVNIDALSSTQAKQVFLSGVGVRDIAAQKNWLAQQEQKAATKPPKHSDYTIKGTTVVFEEGAELNRKQLTKILTELL